jgi:hypothetical protein
MKNIVQFQKGYSLVEFMKDYGTEERCRKALFQYRGLRAIFVRNVAGKVTAR